MGGEDGDGAPRFVPAPRLTDDDVHPIVETATRRVLRLCQRRGRLSDAECGFYRPVWMVLDSHDVSS